MLILPQHIAHIFTVLPKLTSTKVFLTQPFKTALKKYLIKVGKMWGVC